MDIDRPSAADDLQFEHAELPGATPFGCAGCGTSIDGTYFEVNGRIACPSCRDRIVEARGRGSRAARLLAASVLGAGAAAVGAIIWYGIREATNYEVGLVAIGVGLLVGMAVQRGSGGRGGLPYQALAVVLTYLAIASANAPYVWVGIRSAIAQNIQAEMTKQDASRTGAVDAPSAEAEAKAAQVMHHLPPAAWVTMAGIVMGSPFVGGISNVIGWLIMFFGLQQAWRLTRPAPFEVTGPFALAARAPSNSA